MTLAHLVRRAFKEQQVLLARQEIPVNMALLVVRARKVQVANLGHQGQREEKET